MRHKIPTIRSTCKRFDDALTKATIKSVALEVTGEQVPPKPNPEDLQNACRACEKEIGLAKFRKLLKEAADSLYSTTVSQLAENLDTDTANDLMDEFGQTLLAVMCGESKPRNVSMQFLEDLVARLKEMDKLINWGKIARSIRPGDFVLRSPSEMN